MASSKSSINRAGEKFLVGRHNHYRIMATLPLRHPIENHRTIGDILNLIGDRK